MWLSQRLREKNQTPEAVQGEVTIGGETAAVATFAETRGVAVYAPGGYIWRPSAGDGVLVFKGGTCGEEKYIVAAKNAPAPVSVGQGEIYIYSKGASIKLGNGGRIDVTGELYINGEKYKPCTCTGGTA